MEMMKRLEWNKKTALVFAVAVALTIVLVVALLYASLVAVSAKTLVLEWPPEQQEIVDGTFRIELTLEWEHESLSITAKINDDEYYEPDCLALVFFRANESGEVDFWHHYNPYIFAACNMTTGSDSIVIIKHRDNRSWHPGQDEELGSVTDIVRAWPRTSPYHNCTFTEGTGYLFNISIPKSELVNVNADVVYVSFYDLDAETQWASDWVSRRVWGWR
jgi:hypothetical protein